MPELVCKQGTILVESGAVLPNNVTLQSGAYTRDWNSVAHLDKVGLEAEIAKAGWTFFYMAGEIRKNAFGSDEGRRSRAAMGRVIGDALSQNCNCVEVTHVANKSFLGLPYVSITAHARHIQNGSQFRAL